MRSLAAVLAFALGLATGANAGIVTKIRDNGPDSNRLVLVLVAEGYTAAEQAAFNRDAEATMRDYLATHPWSAYPRHVNVYTDFVPSNESGADKPAACYDPEVLKDTAFNARYCSANIQRLLTVSTGLVLGEILVAVPQADLVGVQVNDPEYGGAGGSVLTFSINSGARSEIFLHEAGHTFADLADEYTTPYPGFPPGDGEPNVDYDSVSGSIDWDPWIEPSTPLPTPVAMTTVVGAFEGARYRTTGIYRPKADCKMRSLNRPFCEVCSEATVQSIYAVVSPVDGAIPDAGVVAYDPCDATASVTLEVVPLMPADPSWISATWEVNGVPQPGGAFTLTLPVADLAGGTHFVTATVRDDTPLVRRPFLDPMTDTVTWTLEPRALDDRDLDGVSDGCDCAPDDPSASAPPSLEVAGTHVRRPSDVTWIPAAAGHDIARGLVGDLRATGAYSGTCLAGGPGGVLPDGDLPGAGNCFWYLVRAANACGTGPWGARSDGAGRSVAACP